MTRRILIMSERFHQNLRLGLSWLPNRKVSGKGPVAMVVSVFHSLNTPGRYVAVT